jgi:poly(hydroxyalkanoate) granule-associated protein
MATRKSGSRSRQSTAPDTGNDATKAIADSAQRIWLAGLGAFERARAEGPRMFDTLVEQGKSLGGQARDAADQALRNLREGATTAGGRFDKLEQVFEERVSKSLQRLGVLTRGEVADLSQNVRDLSDQVRAMMAEQSRSSGGGGKRAGTATKAKRKARRAAGTAGRKAKRAAKSA